MVALVVASVVAVAHLDAAVLVVEIVVLVVVVVFLSLVVEQLEYVANVVSVADVEEEEDQKSAPLLLRRCYLHEYHRFVYPNLFEHPSSLHYS